MPTPTISIEPFVFICHYERSYIKNKKECLIRVIENPRLKIFYVEKNETGFWKSIKDFSSKKAALLYIQTNFIIINLNKYD
jgi:hypothetical protein